MPSEADPASPRRAWLNQADRKCVASLAALALAAIGLSVLGPRGDEIRLVDLSGPVVIENAPIAFQLDVNRADWPEWTLLPRIGETLARRIVESRESAGLFESHDDLLRVSGIGPKTLANVRPYLLPLEPTDSVLSGHPG